MRRIIPSKLGARNPVTQLGSLEAVIRAMPDGGTLIISRRADLAHLDHAFVASGAAAELFDTFFSSDGPNELYRIPPETVIGVDVDAFAGVPSEVWIDMQRIISSRFKTVHWG